MAYVETSGNEQSQGERDTPFTRRRVVHEQDDVSIYQQDEEDSQQNC